MEKAHFTSESVFPWRWSLIFFWQKRHGWVTWNFSLVLNWNGLFPNGYGFVWVHGKWGPGGGPKKFFLTKSVSCLARINHTFPDPYGVLAIVTLFIDRFSLVLRCLLTFKAMLLLWWSNVGVSTSEGNSWISATIVVYQVIFDKYAATVYEITILLDHHSEYVKYHIIWVQLLSESN